MSKVLNKKIDQSGFTLIEVLIVVMIIGLLASFGVGGYLQFRRASLINFEVDNFISQFNEIRFDLLNGHVNSDRISSVRAVLARQKVDVEPIEELCYGVYFLYDLEQKTFIPAKFSQNYSNELVWDNELIDWVKVGCKEMTFSDLGFGDETLSLEEFSFDEDVQFKKIEIQSNNGKREEINESFAIRFSPPDASVDLKIGINEFRDFSDSNDFIIFDLNYFDARVSEKDRSLKLNPVTNTFELELL